MENDSSDSDANVVVITSVTPSPSTSSSCRENVTPARRIPANKNERAPCWEIFNIKEGNDSVAVCTICAKEYSRGNKDKGKGVLGTSNLKRHLVQSHREEYDAAGK